MLKPELQAKFLQHLSSRKKNVEEGFTLIELLVVIIIIGVLAAIALPSLLNQVSKGRQAEAKQNTGAINRAQQAYYLENSNNFTTSIGDLAIGIKTQTTNYTYDITGVGTGTPIVYSLVTNRSRSIVPKLKSYAGVVYTQLQTVGAVNENVTLAVLCENVNPAGTGGTSVSASTPDPILDGLTTDNANGDRCPSPSTKVIK